MVQLLEIWISSSKHNRFTYLKRFILFFSSSTASNHRGCLCDNWQPSFLLLLILDWRTFSRRVTTRWWRQWAKTQVPTNQNWRNRWCLIVRPTMCILEPTRALKFASRGKFWTADWKVVTADLKTSPNLACCGSCWLGWGCFTNFPHDSSMVPPCFPYDSPVVSLGSWLVPSRFP